MPKINARAKGHTFERENMHLFRELGYDKCVTSRSESKNLDDLGIDLVYTGIFDVQCKRVEKLNVSKTMSEMPERDGQVPIVMHKQNRYPALVTIKRDDFMVLLKKMREAGILD
jgi:hypothetical protein